MGRRLALVAGFARRIVSLVALLVLVLTPVDTGAAIGVRGNVHVRGDASGDLDGASTAARAQLARRLGPRGFADTAPASRGLAFLGRSDGFLTGPSTSDPADVALAYVRAHLDAFGLDAGDLGALHLSDRYTSLDGVTHLIWQQRTRGIDSFDTFLGANVTTDGRLVNVTGAPAADLELDSAEPAVGARDALAAARADVGGTPLLPPSSGRAAGPTRRTGFSGGRESARLVAFADGERTRLAWQVNVLGGRGVLYAVIVDARSGGILARRSLTAEANSALIYDLHPDQRIAPRVENLGADPSWIDRSEGGTKLQGNNAHATSFVEFTGDPTEVAQVGGNWSFPVQFFNHAECPVFGCTWDSDDFPTRLTNREQTTTQAFWFVNHFHDHLLKPPIGFDEASRNFEHVNTSGQGLGGDAVNVFTNLRSFGKGRYAHGVDGTAPEIHLYRNITAPDIRASDSAATAYHEYAHGLTSRLVGAGTGGCCPGVFGRALSEGWSDWYAEDLIVQEGLVADGEASGEVFHGGYVDAGRTEAIDCAVGASAAVCPGAGTAGPGGYTFGDFTKVVPTAPFEEHANGEIWAQTLWDLRTRIGANTARCLVTGGLRLSPASPDFLTARDAILQQALVVGVPQATVWDVFAARGMGASATTGTPPNEDFTVPDDLPPPPAPTGTCGGSEPSPPPPAGGGTPSGEAGGGPTTGDGQTTGSGSSGGGPTSAQVATALAGDVKPIARALRRLGIRGLVRRRGFSATRLDALTAGRFHLKLTGRAQRRRGSRAAAKNLTIAKGSRTVSRPGRYTVKLKLTKKGGRLLRRAREHVRGKLIIHFTRRSGETLTSSAALTLARAVRRRR